MFTKRRGRRPSQVLLYPCFGSDGLCLEYAPLNEGDTTPFTHIFTPYPPLFSSPPLAAGSIANKDTQTT